MKPVILFLCSLIAACAPKMVSHPVIAPPPPKSAAITPVADTVRKNFSANAVVAAKLEGQVEGLRKSTDQLKADLDKAVDESARLKVAKTASEAELAGLYDTLKGVDEKVAVFQTEAIAAESTAAHERALRQASEENVAALMTAAADKDASDKALAGENAGLRSALDLRGKDLDTMQAKLEAAKEDAGIGRLMKRLAWTLVISMILIVIAKMFLSKYLPFLQ